MIPALDTEKTERVALVERAANAAWDEGSCIQHVRVTYLDQVQQVLIANSAGFVGRETRHRTRMIADVVAARDGRVVKGSDGPGAAQGLEFYTAVSPEAIGRRAARQAVRGLDAGPAPTGEMTVVLHPGEGGVFIHEACGHGLEGDVITRGTSVYGRTIGDRLGDAEFSVVDDGTVAGEWSSAGFDDEGSPTRRTLLFDRGRQVGVLTDRLTAASLNREHSGNGRRQSYESPPRPRMTNTVVLPGTADPDEIVRQVRRGLYATRLSGGEANSATGDFVFGVTEGFLIENGRLTRPTGGVVLTGNGPETIGLIDAVGSDFGAKQGMCGKAGQWVPASFGAPTMRIARLTVGGRAT